MPPVSGAALLDRRAGRNPRSRAPSPLGLAACNLAATAVPAAAAPPGGPVPAVTFTLLTPAGRRTFAGGGVAQASYLFAVSVP